MRLPNLLATRRGRLFAFFSLYVTEGIPLGFAATAVATQLRRQGVGPAEIGAFVASFYLPWAFKWAFGPFVDVFRSQRFGHRRGWILITQIVMAATLLSLVAVPLPAGLGLFTMILLVHNTFGAIQDVAIDSLACNTLSEDERGLANGLMFAGAAVGQAVGGSGVLFLISITGFQFTFVAVAAAILAVTGFIVLPMKETVAASLGAAVEAWGYPVTLLVDAITGLLCLLLLPMLKRQTAAFSDALAEGRARKSSLVLGVCCLGWLPYWANHDVLGKGQPMMGTFFTLVFIASALFLLAGREVLGRDAGVWRRAALWVSPMLMLMYGRYWVDKLGGMPALRNAAEVLMYAVPLAAGIVLVAMAFRDWRTLSAQPQAA
jgi:MFS family permease